MLIAFRIICMIFICLSGWWSINTEDEMSGASIVFLMSGTFFLISFALEMIRRG